MEVVVVVVYTHQVSMAEWATAEAARAEETGMPDKVLFLIQAAAAADKDILQMPQAAQAEVESL
jgi:hypothetical protein